MWRKKSCSQNDDKKPVTAMIGESLLQGLSAEGGVKLGYQVDAIEHIATGGCSYVYSANKKTENFIDGSITVDAVVLKVTTEQRIRLLCQCAPPDDDIDERVKRIMNRCSREADKLRKLRHASIVSFIDTIQLTGNNDLGQMYVLMMEYCQGGTLASKIEQRLVDGGVKFPEFKIRRWFFQLALALDYAHQEGIVHLDVKPANVFIFQQGDDDSLIKLGDFGIARTVQVSLENRVGHSQSSTVANMLTAHYCSLERLNYKEPTPKDDVWSYGVSLYETATLHPPYEGTAMTVAISIYRDIRRSLCDFGLSNDISELSDKLLTKDPSLRPDMAAVVNDPLFQKDISLEDILARSKENLWQYYAEKVDKKLPLGDTLNDRALRRWLYQLKEARFALRECYVGWKDKMDKLLEVYEAAANVICDKEFTANVITLVGASTSIVGVALGAAGVITTVATLGLMTPVGVGLIVSGIAVGGLGTVTVVGTKIKEMLDKKAEIVVAKAKEEPARAAEKALEASVKNLYGMLPPKWLKEFNDRFSQQDKDKVSGWFQAMVVSRLVLRGADVAADVVQLAVKPAAQAAAVVGYVLLPLGAILDIATIGVAAHNIDRTRKAKQAGQQPPTVVEVMEKFKQSLHSRQDIMTSRIDTLLNIVQEKIDAAEALPKMKKNASSAIQDTQIASAL